MATSIDVRKQAERFAGLGPLERIRAAEFQGGLARELIGHFAEIRRAAIAEAHVQELETGLSQASVRLAVRPERRPLQRVLELLLQPGVCAEPPKQAPRALGARARLRDIARAVVECAASVDHDQVPAEERLQVSAGIERARRLLGMGDEASPDGRDARVRQ